MTLLDQTGTSVTVPDLPVRIISTVPSQTELLYDLGLGDRVVGLTKFCVHPPEWRKSKTVIGGTKNLNLGRIKALKPDLIIGNKEENTREEIETLRALFPTWISDIGNIGDACEMIKSVGVMTQTQKNAQAIVRNILTKLGKTDIPKRGTALYLIWRRPWMSVGGDTFIHDMMSHAGFVNVLADQRRYPVVSEDEIMALAPDNILLSSEPFPFKPIHKEELGSLLQSSRIYIVDGEMFSWYGSRLAVALDYFRTFDTDVG